MKKLSILLITLFMPLAGLLAQDVYINPADPAFREKYRNSISQVNFRAGGIRYENNYYIVDFAQLPGKFEKVYFLNLVFKSDKVVNIDPDLKQDRIWFLAVKTTRSRQCTIIFSTKEKNGNGRSRVYGSRKDQWLQKNDKYK